MDWERGNKIIVYCSRKTGRTCSGGSPVIPHEHPREVYVKSAKANDRWVIVKALTTESDKLCYYLIDKSFNIKNLDWEIVNCDSIIQSHIISTFDSISFEKILRDKNFGEPYYLKRFLKPYSPFSLLSFSKLPFIHTFFACSESPNKKSTYICRT